MRSLTFALLILSTTSLCAENWPGWRGPRGDGSSAETDLPLNWSAEDNIAWKVKLPFTGHSSPIVWEDRVFLVGTDRESETRMLWAVDRKTGETLWTQEVLQSPLERKHKLNSYASSTPVTDGQRVYVSFLDQKEMCIAAYSLEGKKLWLVRPGIFSSVHGYCSSPILYKDKLIINGDHDGKAYIVALKRTDGGTVWKTERENKKRSYCTPIIREIDGQMQMILSGSKCVASYNPDDGKRLWIVDGPTEQFVASLVYGHGLVYVTAGFPEKHVMAIDPTGKGNVTDTKVVWWNPRKNAAYVPSPVVVDDYLYVVADNGIGYCYNAMTGAMHWKERMGRRFSASLVSSENRIYILDDDGNTTVLQTGDEYKELAVNKLGEQTYASPVVSQGQIFIRGEQHLFCIGKAKQLAARKR